MWSTGLRTPGPQNPFGSGGDAYGSIDIGKNTAATLWAEWCAVVQRPRRYLDPSTVRRHRE